MVTCRKLRRFQFRPTNMQHWRILDGTFSPMPVISALRETRVTLRGRLFGLWKPEKTQSLALCQPINGWRAFYQQKNSWHHMLHFVKYSNLGFSVMKSVPIGTKLWIMTYKSLSSIISEIQIETPSSSREPKIVRFFLGQVWRCQYICTFWVYFLSQVLIFSRMSLERPES